MGKKGKRENTTKKIREIRKKGPWDGGCGGGDEKRGF